MKTFSIPLRYVFNRILNLEQKKIKNQTAKREETENTNKNEIDTRKKGNKWEYVGESKTQNIKKIH